MAEIAIKRRDARDPSAGWRPQNEYSRPMGSEGLDMRGVQDAKYAKEIEKRSSFAEKMAMLRGLQMGKKKADPRGRTTLLGDAARALLTTGGQKIEGSKTLLGV